jgi:hypothetical protein
MRRSTDGRNLVTRANEIIIIIIIIKGAEKN